jgi:hypothetical protein
MGTSRGLALPVTVGGIGGGAPRGESRDTTLLPPTDWSLNWRKDCWCLLIVNEISKTAKFFLNRPKMNMNALIVAPSVAL